jgi:hypothetical protein
VVKPAAHRLRPRGPGEHGAGPPPGLAVEPAYRPGSSPTGPPIPRCGRFLRPGVDGGLPGSGHFAGAAAGPGGRAGAGCPPGFSATSRPPGRQDRRPGRGDDHRRRHLAPARRRDRALLRRLQPGRGDRPGRHRPPGPPRGVAWYALDPGNAARLWELSQKVGQPRQARSGSGQYARGRSASGMAECLFGLMPSA